MAFLTAIMSEDIGVIEALFLEEKNAAIMVLANHIRAPHLAEMGGKLVILRGVLMGERYSL